jgi:hypothetical protein
MFHPVLTHNTLSTHFKTRQPTLLLIHTSSTRVYQTHIDKYKQKNTAGRMSSPQRANIAISVEAEDCLAFLPQTMNLSCSGHSNSFSSTISTGDVTQYSTQSEEEHRKANIDENFDILCQIESIKRNLDHAEQTVVLKSQGKSQGKRQKNAKGIATVGRVRSQARTDGCQRLSAKLCEEKENLYFSWKYLEAQDGFAQTLKTSLDRLNHCMVTSQHSRLTIIEHSKK